MARCGRLFLTVSITVKLEEHIYFPYYNLTMYKVTLPYKTLLTSKIFRSELSEGIFKNGGASPTAVWEG